MGNHQRLRFSFVFFPPCWVFVAVHRLSLVEASKGHSLVAVCRELLLLQNMGSRYPGFSSCSTRAQQLWHTGLVAPWHVESSRTKDRTHIPGINFSNIPALREVHSGTSYYQFILKGYNSGTATWKRYTGQSLWEGSHNSCSWAMLLSSYLPDPGALGFN